MMIMQVVSIELLFAVPMLLLVTVGVYIVLPWGYRISARRKLLQEARISGKVFLTFDDGPDPRATPQILDILDEYDSKATFFMVGENIEKYPDIAREVVSRGHDLGYHSHIHTHGFKSGPIRTYRDLAKDALSCVTGRHTKLYRPPYGKLNLVSLLYVIRSGLHPVYWDVDPHDYEASSSDEISDYVLEHIQSGSIVLLHDGRRNNNADISVTAIALEKILKCVNDQGFQYGTITELHQ